MSAARLRRLSSAPKAAALLTCLGVHQQRPQASRFKGVVIHHCSDEHILCMQRAQRPKLHALHGSGEQRNRARVQLHLDLRGIRCTSVVAQPASSLAGSAERSPLAMPPPSQPGGPAPQSRSRRCMPLRRGPRGWAQPGLEWATGGARPVLIRPFRQGTATPPPRRPTIAAQHRVDGGCHPAAPCEATHPGSKDDPRADRLGEDEGVAGLKPALGQHSIRLHTANHREACGSARGRRV